MALPPAFWRQDGLLPRLLSPLSRMVAAITARRVARPGWRAPVPVICCGNVTVGGAGKTTVALDIAARLIAHGHHPHILLRGYGGSSRGPRRVVPGDSAALTGDEALLLAQVAPTWTGADRAASARMAVAAGADVLVMDDGLQNPTLYKDLSLLVVDGAVGFGNQRVLPAGPLREPIATGAARCQAAIVIGDGAKVALPPYLPVLRARLIQGPEMQSLRDKNVIAFAGIATPAKFFAPLKAAGVRLIACVPFTDHHRFTRPELDQLLSKAAAANATLATTPKDAQRLPPDFLEHVVVVSVTLQWEQPGAIDRLLASTVTR